MSKWQLSHKDIQEALAETWADDKRPPKNKIMLLDAIKYTVYDPFTPVWREIRELYIIPVLDKVFNGKEDAKSAVNRIIGKVDNLLRQAR